ncbi:20034_t:CDS:2, partial [Dentiscutata erythropus]
HTFYKEKELDILIIDSEEMGSTAAKYISRHTDFDKKITLLGFMCSQILIVNTKELTRDISDTLEVSSYHLEALNNRKFNKPKVSFVLRDMINAKTAQQPAFKDICEGLKKMFYEILGCFNIDNFMIVEEQDIYLLKNAFTCFFDDFYSKSTIDSENFHYPSWSAMKRLACSYYETTIKFYKENELKLIEEQTSKGQWNENNNIDFENYLTQETKMRCAEVIADFKEKISNQYDAQIIDEGETYIKLAFAAKKLDLKAIYEKRQRQSKESWLIKLAQIRIERIEKDIENFMHTMTKEVKELKQHVVNSFNQAIEDGCTASNNKSNSENNRIFWNKATMPATLNKIFLDNIDKQIIDSIKITTKSSLFKQYLRFKVFTALEDSTAKWKASQQNNLNELRENLLKYFNDILSNTSYKNISAHFIKYVDKAVEKQLVIQEEYISKSFGKYDVEKTRKYIHNPTSFMKELFENDIEIVKGIKVEERLEKIEKEIKDALEKLGVIILTCQQNFSESDKNLPLEEIILNKEMVKNETKDMKLNQRIFVSSNETICPENSIEDAICVLGKYRIDNSKASYWNKVKGCRYRCPYCGSKCELEEHKPNTNHRASFHFMTCFGGVHKIETRHANLTICNEPGHFNQNYREGDNDEIVLPFEEHIKKHHLEWWPLLERKQPDDDQIKQVRVMWIHLKDEICSKFNIVDVTPESCLVNPLKTSASLYLTSSSLYLFDTINSNTSNQLANEG